jgi:hypothetical protein
MVGEVPLAPRVEDKEDAREKSRVPLWRNNSLRGLYLCTGPVGTWV